MAVWKLRRRRLLHPVRLADHLTPCGRSAITVDCASARPTRVDDGALCPHACSRACSGRPRSIHLHAMDHRNFGCARTPVTLREPDQPDSPTRGLTFNGPRCPLEHQRPRRMDVRTTRQSRPQSPDPTNAWSWLSMSAKCIPEARTSGLNRRPCPRNAGSARHGGLVAFRENQQITAAIAQSLADTLLASIAAYQPESPRFAASSRHRSRLCETGHGGTRGN